MMKYIIKLMGNGIHPFILSVITDTHCIYITDMDKNIFIYLWYIMDHGLCNHLPALKIILLKILRDKV